MYALHTPCVYQMLNHEIQTISLCDFPANCLVLYGSEMVENTHFSVVVFGMISLHEIVAPESPSSLLSSACCFIIAEDENVTRGCPSSMLCFTYCL